MLFLRRLQDAHGRDIYWIGPPGKAKEAGEGTDFFVTAQGYVSVTPLQIDLTNTKQLLQLQELQDDFGVSKA